MLNKLKLALVFIYGLIGFASFYEISYYLLTSAFYVYKHKKSN